MKAKLPDFLEFQSASDLIRLGRDHDGGYLVSAKDVENSDVLIGLGVGDDWSFEEGFCLRNNVPVYAYDASVSKVFFLRQVLKAIPRLTKPEVFMRNLKTYRSYLRFFKGSNRHIEKFVDASSGDRCTSMKHVLEITTSNSIFLKIDIEGSEYHILDAILTEQSRIAGLVIEFHDCDQNLEQIKAFIQSFKLSLIHIHANNHAALSQEGGFPLVMELTFSRNASLLSGPVLPNLLDMPNNRDKEEIVLHFR